MSIPSPHHLPKHPSIFGRFWDATVIPTLRTANHTVVDDSTGGIQGGSYTQIVRTLLALAIGNFVLMKYITVAFPQLDVAVIFGKWLLYVRFYIQLQGFFSDA